MHDQPTPNTNGLPSVPDTDIPTPRTAAMDPDEPLQPSQARAPEPPRRRSRPRARPAALSKPGLAVRLREPARVLRRGRTGQGRGPRVPRQRGDRDHRPLRLWQVDDGALHQPHARGDPRRPRRGPGAARRLQRLRTLGRRRRRAPRDRDGLPEAQPLPDDVRVRQRRRRPAPDLARRAAKAASSPRSKRHCAAPGCGRRSPTACTSPARASPAASSSGCASPARSRSIPR